MIALRDFNIAKDMEQDFVFSWAENADGKMVHVDTVQNGLGCGCTCPCCHERLMARQGEERAHGFAHQSKIREANLKICYEVSMYKLAEQIIQTEKRIHVPPYNTMFPEGDLVFKDVVVDSRYERDDKQPDVIATTKEGKQYLIVFYLKNRTFHKQTLDYKNLSCLEVDLSNQSLESLSHFLLSSSEDRKWLNYENRIFPTDLFDSQLKSVDILPENRTCFNCEIHLAWATTKDGWAYCGSPYIAGLSNQKVNPNYAKECKIFKPIPKG